MSSIPGFELVDCCYCYIDAKNNLICMPHLELLSTFAKISSDH